jgi:energy-coupling factor transport system ATP-binding protein
METPLLLVDEPTSQLDPWTTEQIFSMIGAMRETDTTVLLAENKIDELVRVADESVIMDDGHLVFAGPAGEAFAVAEARGIRCGVPEPYKLAQSLDVQPRWLTPLDAADTLTGNARRTGTPQ